MNTLTTRRLSAVPLTALALVLAFVQPVRAQSAPAAPPAPSRPAGSIFWLVGGAGFTVARAGCPTCDRAGVFTNSRGFLVDAGLRVSPRVDAGVEMTWVSSKLEGDGDSIRTAFVLGVGQFRPWTQHGLFIKAGMGIGIVGNGLYSPIGPDLAPPFTTNTLALMYGTGWIFRRERRVTVQVHGSHHVVALGELTTITSTSVKNVVGNYWTAGTAIVIR